MLLYYDENISHSSRYDYSNNFELIKLFNDNKDLFKLALYKEFNDKKVIFSHAGITKGWYNNIAELVNNAKGEELVTKLNELMQAKDIELAKYLDYISYLRWGLTQFGSIIWADVLEHNDVDNEGNDKFYQIFGHTQQEKDPIITDKFACLDCRKPFEINESGEIKYL